MSVMLLLAALGCGIAGAAPPKSLALPEREVIDEMRDYTGEEARRENERRFALAGSELARQFDGRGLYRVVHGDAGPERVARFWVQKVSNLILNVNIEVRSAATGEVLYVSSVDVRGNTDEAWLRGVRRLVDNIEARQHHLR